MKEINIAGAITRKRKEKGITQEELACYIGVSKASVSKWETGQSYPDIVFLPQLASYFNISLDELMGYQPQMTDEEIKELYYRLAEKFSRKPFEEVMEECREVTKKYFACLPLLLQIAVLYINHFGLAREKERQNEVLEEAKSLCRRIKEESQEIGMCRQANTMEAMAEVALGNPQAAAELLEDVNDPMMGEEVILANACYLTGDVEKAKETIQVGLFRHVLGFVGDVPQCLMLYVEEKERFEEILRRALAVCSLFHMEQLHPSMLSGIYMTGANGYASQGEYEKALELLRKFADLFAGMNLLLISEGDSFFDKISGWLGQLKLGLKPPRDEKTIRQSMLDVVEHHPVFAPLKNYEQYRRIVEKLKSLV